MYKGPLVGWHGLEPNALLLDVGGEDSELALLLLCPFGIVTVQLQRGVGVGDMIVCMVGVNIERIG